MQTTSEQQKLTRQQQIREASDRELRASKGIPSAAYPKLISIPRTEMAELQKAKLLQ